MFLSLAFQPRCLVPSNPNYTPLRDRLGSFRSFVRSFVRSLFLRSLSSESGYFVDDLQRKGSVSRLLPSAERSEVERRSIDSCHKVASPSTSYVGEIPRRVTLVRFCFLSFGSVENGTRRFREKDCRYIRVHLSVPARKISCAARTDTATLIREKSMTGGRKKSRDKTQALARKGRYRASECQQTGNNYIDR